MNSNDDIELVKQLQEIPPDQFEEFVADLWESDGYRTRVVGKSGDRGIDVIAERDNLVSERILIQAKRYSSTNTVGSPEIQQYASLIHQQKDVDKAVVVSTSQFSSQAEELAEQHGLDLIAGSELENHIREKELTELVHQYGSDSASERENDSSLRTRPDTPNQIRDVGQQFDMELVALRDEKDINEYTDGVYFEVYEGQVRNRIAAFFEIENVGGRVKIEPFNRFLFLSKEGYEYKVDPASGGLKWSMPGTWSDSLDLSHGQKQSIVIISTEIPDSVVINKIEFGYEGEILEFHIPSKIQDKLKNNTLDIDVNK